MKRYYICTIIGTGASTSDAHRPAIADIVDPSTHLKAFNMSAIYAINSDGSLKLPWALVIAAGPNHALTNGNPNIDALPDYPLDVKLSSMDNVQKGKAFAKLAARGIDTSALGNADGYRGLIRLIGQLHVPDFSEDSFDVVDA